MNAVLIILGPTASGKSSLALKAAHDLKGTIINGDSMQIYKNFPILSASPISQEGLPHALYGLFDLEHGETCSASLWMDLATQEVEKALTRNRQPIIVGGTGFYIKALLEGLSPIPDVPTHIRERLLKEMKNPSMREELYAYLKDHDPQTTILPGDTQRIIRSLEILIHTKKPLSHWQSLPKEKALPYPTKIVALTPAREALYDTINIRAEIMLQNGALEEVKNFHPPTHTSLPSGLKSIGYEEIKDFLEGGRSLEDTLRAIQQRSRQYAKRQMTWIRHQITPDLCVAP